eukprot:11288623-Karenia_brevis.AAC.1
MEALGTKLTSKPGDMTPVVHRLSKASALFWKLKDFFCCRAVPIQKKFDEFETRLDMGPGAVQSTLYVGKCDAEEDHSPSTQARPAVCLFHPNIYPAIATVVSCKVAPQLNFPRVDSHAQDGRHSLLKDVC